MLKWYLEPVAEANLHTGRTNHLPTCIQSSPVTWFAVALPRFADHYAELGYVRHD